MKAGHGFTLIEVLITMVILGVLAAIAIPQYSAYVIRSRIPEATNALANTRIKMEQFYQDNRSYQNGGACGAAVPVGLAAFDVTCDAPTANTYTITATGKGPMTSFVFTIDQAGTRSTTSVPPKGGWVAKNNCWITRQGGGC